ncbi:MAG: hypothetical protein U0228_31080 [Myxococcaceae bacterium]
MSERFRYRQLTAVRDPEAVAAMKADFQSQAIRPRDYAAAGARAEDEAPKAVLANESQGTREEIERMLREGELMPSDLVYSGGGWTTFEQSPDFFEACEGVTDTRALGQNVGAIFKFLGGALLVIVVIILRVLARH